MTVSPKTNHAEQAVGILHALDGNTPDPADAAVTANLRFAQVHATLALEAQTARLADEQRTANLLARQTQLFAIASSPSANITAAGAAEINWLEEQIAARLDITQDVTP